KATPSAPTTAAAPKAGNLAPPVPSANDVRLSPAARVLVESQGIDASKIPASGRGAVTKSDVLAYLESKPAPAAPPPPPPPVQAAPPTPPPTPRRPPP